LIGPCLIIIGMTTIGTAHRMDVAIGGSAIAGVGGALAEIAAVAGLLELAPAKSRGKYIGMALLPNLPFGATLTYGQSFRLTKLTVAQLYSLNTWRWGAWIPAMLVGLDSVILFIFYHPPPRLNSLGLSKLQLISRIDFVGTILSVGGIALF